MAGELQRLVFELASRGPTLARQAGMNPTDLRALVLLLDAQRRGETVGPGWLAGHLDLTTAAATTVVDRLVALGLARRRPAETDRRRVVVELTGNAHASGLDALGQIVALICTRVEGYPPVERAAVARFLTDVLAITQEHARPEGG